MLVFMPIFLLIVLASFILWIYALIDVARRQFADSTTKLIWLLVVIFLHGLGAIIYLLVGRQQGTLA
jgi:Phospholipase_D-nuclease N-terminal